MKKLFVRSIALLLSMLTAFCVVGCGKNSSDKEPEVQQTEYTLWTTYNTVKVVQDSALNGNYEQLPVGINVAMCKNESEMGSFYVTVKNGEIKSFDLTASELKNENGDVFPTSQMKVYAQKYVNVKTKSRGNKLTAYPVGWMPDPLVPVELYKNEEEDKIQTGKNQGFSVDFKATGKTPCGVYTGTFSLTLDDKKENIPVKVEVWDIDLLAKDNGHDGKSAAMSCVAIYDRQVRQSEGYSEDTEEFKEWYRKYFEQALEYKMNPWTVPDAIPSRTKTIEENADAFVDSVKKYWNHPNFDSFGMPHQSFIDGSKEVWKEYYRKYLYKFAVASAEDKIDYLALAYFYPADEPTATGDGGYSAYDDVIELIEILRNLMKEVQAQIENDRVFEKAGCDEEFTQKCKNSLLHIELVITAGVDNPLNGLEFTTCPTFELWGDYFSAQQQYAYAEEYGTSLWYYSHIHPYAPSPTVHIDDYLLSTRLLKWMQKYYNLDGYLYYDYCSALWSDVKTQTFHGENRYEIVNKEEGLAANGDGFFVYPAAKYGADEPIISMRLVAYRDGQDDMDMINYLGALYSEYENYYGLEKGTLDVNRIIKPLYDRVLCNITAFAEESKEFDAIRATVKDLIINAKKDNGNKFVYYVDYNGNCAVYTFYTASGYTIKVNGQALESIVSGNGLKHVYSMNCANTSPLTSVEVVKGSDSETVKLFESNTMRAVDVSAADFEVAVSENSAFNKDTDNKSITFDIQGKMFDDAFDAGLFVPRITFTSLKSFKVLEYFCENTSDTDAKMTITVITKDGSSISYDVGLPAHTSDTIRCLNKYPDKEIRSVSIGFINGYAEKDGYRLVDPRTIVISAMTVR